MLKQGVSLFLFLLIELNLIVNVRSLIYNIKDTGAIGDGMTDDTTAIQQSINECLNSGGVLFIPTGRFVVRSSLIFQTTKSFTILGEGFSSVLLWEFNDHLLVISPGKSFDQIRFSSKLSNLGNASEISGVTIRDFVISSASVAKSSEKFSIYATNLVRSHIEHVLINSEDSKISVPSGIAMLGVADTNTIRDVGICQIQGTGIQIGHGSEIRIAGGRLIGNSIRFDDSIGIHCTGNNGGVHIENTDVIALGKGILLENLFGDGSNREIFISHATIDSNGRGLIIRDNSYVSIIGLWAASNTIDQIFIDQNTTALLNVNGGTIFNAGIYECPKDSQWCNGITILSGSVILNGLEIRNNQGRAIWMDNPSIGQVQITSSRIFANGQAFYVNVSTFIIANNICSSNKQANVIVPSQSSIVKDNLGC